MNDKTINEFGVRMYGLFKVPYFPVGSSTSSALRNGLTTPAPQVHWKIKMAAINGKTRYISTNSRKNKGL